MRKVANAILFVSATSAFCGAIYSADGFAHKNSIELLIGIALLVVATFGAAILFTLLRFFTSQS